MVLLIPWPNLLQLFNLLLVNLLGLLTDRHRV